MFSRSIFLLFIVGIYFVHIPWNIERLSISELELGIGILIFGISIFVSNQLTGRLIVPLIGTTNLWQLEFRLFLSVPFY